MRIHYLLQGTELCGGVKVVIEDANHLARRGHDVTIVSRGPRPDWITLDCAFAQVDHFASSGLPAPDLCIGTLWTTVPAAVEIAPQGAVHFCQGFEADLAEWMPLEQHIRSVYSLPGVRHLVVSPHLEDRLLHEFGIRAALIPQALDHSIHFPNNRPRRPGPFRIGVVGPGSSPTKGTGFGVAACWIASQAGMDLQLVRVTPEDLHVNDAPAGLPIEVHHRVRPEDMGALYRSLDILLCTAADAGEGFYLPALEAMACGVPCVLTDIPCFRAHGLGDSAWFVPPRDAAAFARAIAAIPRDPQRRQRAIEEGLTVAQRYSRQARTDRLEQALLAFCETDPLLARVAAMAAAAL